MKGLRKGAHMTEAKVVEAKVEVVDNEEEVIVDQKKKLTDRIARSKPVSFVRRHAKAVAAGAVATAAAGAAMVVAAKAVANGAAEVPFDSSEIKDAISDAISEVKN